MDSDIKESEDIFGPDEYSRLRLLRTVARTRRCHTMLVIHPQSVGEHTFGVIAILDIIAPSCRKEVWRAALFHDAPEAITGDVPAPAKWAFPAVEDALRVAEASINAEYGMSVLLHDEEHKLLKFADLMELVWYGIEEMRMGNREVSRMVSLALGAVKKRGLGSSTLRAMQFYEYTITAFESVGGHHNVR